MQVTNAISNTIRILFNPTVESFRLFDFLIVQSNESRYLAQIIEIYDDKFDASQNVAKLKLFYRITKDNEVLPYDNFTPNKECEIMKVNPRDIEGFTNQNKETFPFAISAQSKEPLNIQYDFFNSKAIVLADKIENSNAISLSLARKLSEKSNAVIIDFSGALEYKEAKTISAAKDFKLPLNYHTIDYIFSNCLNELNFKFKASGEQILNEIKAYAKSQQNGYIPINALVNVFEQQYKATPYDELKILLERIRTCEIEGIFAKTKKDYETLDKTIQENKMTILNLSTVPFAWQKAYVEHIALDCKEEVYLISRVNEDIFDADLINRIYNKSRKVKLIPCASYSFKKLPTIMQYCKNYILLPSLYQRTDFLDANFALSNLISNGCIIFGENTDNFLYLANDYEINFVEKKNYRKIALSLMKEDGENMEDFEVELKEQNKISDNQKLMKELSELEQTNRKKAEVVEDEQDLPLEEDEEKKIVNDKEEDDTQYFVQNADDDELLEATEQIVKENAQNEPAQVEPSIEPVEEPVEEAQEEPVEEHIQEAQLVEAALSETSEPEQEISEEVPIEPKDEQIIDVEEIEAHSVEEEPSQDLIAQAAQEAMEEELFEQPEQEIVEEAEEIEEIEEVEEVEEEKPSYSIDDDVDAAQQAEAQEIIEINNRKSAHIDDDVEDEITEIKQNIVQEEVEEAQEEPRPDFSDIEDIDRKSLSIDDDVAAYSIDDDVDEPQEEIQEELEEEPKKAAKKTAKKSTKKTSKKASKEEVKEEVKPKSKAKKSTKKKAQEETQEEPKKSTKKTSKKAKSDNEILKEEVLDESDEKETAQAPVETAQEIQQEVKPAEISEDELDFFELMKNDFTADDKQDLVIEDNAQEDIFHEEKERETKNPVEENFENIINNEASSEGLSFSDSDESLSLDDEEESLPVFREERKVVTNPASFESGNVVHHQKYGKGVITKIIKYDDRQLLQIEFAQAGRKLLDPQVAQITLE